MRKSAWTVGAIASVCGMAWAVTAHADDKWWPAKVYDYDSGSQKVVEYSPLEKAAKPWNICVLFPHMKDTFWVAVDYGVVEEAKRLGVNMTLYQAGGYDAQDKLWGLVADGLIRLHLHAETEWQRMRTLMTAYRDTPMDLADASVVAAAEVLSVWRVFTFDSHFYAYRMADGGAFELIQ